MAVHVKEAKSYGYQFGIEHLRSLKKIYIQLLCAGASALDIEDAEDAIHTIVKFHPGHPRIDIQKCGMDMHLEERNKRQHPEETNVQNMNASKEDMNHANKKRKEYQSSSAQ